MERMEGWSVGPAFEAGDLLVTFSDPGEGKERRTSAVHTMRRERLAWLVGFTAWAIIGGLLFLVCWGFDAHQRLLIQGLRPSVETAGTIVSLDTANHDSMEYAYTDSHGQRHRGGDQGDGQEQGDPADLKIGDEITVWYNPQDPRTSCCCTPSRTELGELYRNEITISQFLAIPLAIAIGWQIAHRDRGGSDHRHGRAILAAD